MRVLPARGPVVAALKRYDAGLRVRWSHEKQKWAVEARALRGRIDLTPPVYFVRRNDGEFDEHLLPEMSDRHIAYHDGYYTICWAPRLDWQLFEAVMARDVQRVADPLQNFDEQIYRAGKRRQHEQDVASDERSREAFARFKFLNKTRPWGDPTGA